jgi:CspA family cold shock protein
MSRETGKVKWFSNEKGYGFIERDGLDDVFVHHSEIQMDGFRTLDAGEPVEFELISGEKGPKAQQVVRAEHVGAGAGAGNGASFSARNPLEGDHEPSEDSPTLTEQLKSKFGRRLFGN